MSFWLKTVAHAAGIWMTAIAGTASSGALAPAMPFGAPWVRQAFGAPPSTAASTTVATPVTAKDVQVPYLSGPVVDEAGLLDGASRTRIDGILREVHRQGKLQMVVFIPNSLQGYAIEEFSIRVAEAWKLGVKGEDQGLLLVIAPAERKMRIEVGYGLEGDITDAFSKQVLDDVMRPYFKESRYGDGILAAVSAITQKLGRATDVVPAPRKAARASKRVPVGLIIAILIILTPFILLSMLRNALLGRRSWHRRGTMTRGGWSGGSGWGGGGGFGGFGGGGGGFGG